MATAWILPKGAADVVEAPFDEAVDVARGAADGVAWLEVNPEEFEPLIDALGLHPQAVEDALKAASVLSETAQRTKLDRFEGHVFLYLFKAALDDDTGELALSEIPAFVSPKYVVVVDRARPYETADLVGRWSENPSLMHYGIPTMLYCLLDLVIDSHLQTVDQLADAVDVMEDDLFDASADAANDPRAVQLRSFTNRKSLVRLRRVTQPMRELITGAMRAEDNDSTPIPAQLLPYYQDLYDHVLRVADTIEGLRDLITTIYETRLALYDHSLNTVTRQLAAWAAIIAVPTAVTGFYGQNIPYPGFGRASGYITSTAIWLTTSVVLYIMFKRRRWL